MSLLRVGIDASPMVNGTTGVARYTIQLVEGLRARGDLETATMAIGRGVTGAPIPVDRRVHLPLRLVHATWNVAGRPSTQDLLGPVDVVHAVDTVPPPTDAPLVVTCHDVLPLTRPDLYDERYRRLSERHVASFGEAAAVVTTCEATADEIRRVVEVGPDQLVVAPPGRLLALDPSRRRPSPDPFVLYVGAITPRKGLHRLVAALAELADPPRVVAAGPNGMRAQEVHAALAKFRGRVPLELLGQVSEDDLTRLYETATVLCHPSEAEGFGIPVLEAMGAGVPVVATDIPPTRELTGDAAALVPVGDTAALADTIEHVIGGAARRGDMAEAGVERAAPYTWERMVDTIVRTYRRVTGG